MLVRISILAYLSDSIQVYGLLDYAFNVFEIGEVETVETTVVLRLTSSDPVGSWNTDSYPIKMLE